MYAKRIRIRILKSKFENSNFVSHPYLYIQEMVPCSRTAAAAAKYYIVSSSVWWYVCLRIRSNEDLWVTGHPLLLVHKSVTCCQLYCFWWIIVCTLAICCLTETAARSRACFDHLTKWSTIITSSKADRDHWSQSKVPPSVAQYMKLPEWATVLSVWHPCR